MKVVKVRYLVMLMSLIMTLGVFSCSTKKNTAGSRFWHAFNTRYNVYYNGKKVGFYSQDSWGGIDNFNLDNELPTNKRNEIENITNNYVGGVLFEKLDKLCFGNNDFYMNYAKDKQIGYEYMFMDLLCLLEHEKIYKEYCKKFLLDLGIKEENLRLRDHSKEELSFYSNATTDIEYKFPFGWGELWGIASRTDYDLSQHQKFSGVNMSYLDPETNEKYIPYVIEPSLGVERLVLTVLCNAYHEDELEDGTTREVLSLHPYLAPYKVAVLPLVKKYHSEKAMEVYRNLSKNFMTTYDESGNIGKRYRREDVIGTPFCITIDDETINNNTVTIRDRDTMQQITISLDEVEEYINKRIQF